MDLGSLWSHEASLVGISPLNNFLFLIPPLAWNIAFSAKLPMQHFPNAGVPPWIRVTENIFRAAVMVYPFFLPIRTSHELFVPGVIVHAAGMAAYFASWVMLMYAPQSAATQTAAMRFAPAYLPLVWFTGMSMIADSAGLMVLSLVFVGFHVGEYLYRYEPWRRPPGTTAL